MKTLNCADASAQIDAGCCHSSGCKRTFMTAPISAVDVSSISWYSIGIPPSFMNLNAIKCNLSVAPTHLQVCWSDAACSAWPSQHGEKTRTGVWRFGTLVGTRVS